MSAHLAACTSNPRQGYDELRRGHASLAAVQVADGVLATLVIGYRAALQVLSDPDRFPADPRSWLAAVPDQCPVLPILEWSLGGAQTGDRQHGVSRSAYTASLGKLDLHQVRRVVEVAAVTLINGFCQRGSADLLCDYAVPLTTQVIDHLLGLPVETSARLRAAMAGLREATSAAAADPHDQDLRSAIADAVAAKRAHPAEDLLTSLTTHPCGLDDEEIVAQIAVSYARGSEPTWNLIANTLLLMLTDERFHGLLVSGSLSTRDAIDEVLFSDPPLANSAARFPRQPQVLDGVWLPVDQPVIVSSAACNNDPQLGGHLVGNRAHLAWGAGPRSCPAQSVVLVIVQEALDQLLDALPDIALAVPAEEVRWRPSAFHRAVLGLPVTFPVSPPLAIP